MAFHNAMQGSEKRALKVTRFPNTATEANKRTWLLVNTVGGVAFAQTYSQVVSVQMTSFRPCTPPTGSRQTIDNCHKTSSHDCSGVPTQVIGGGSLLHAPTGTPVVYQCLDKWKSSSRISNLFCWHSLIGLLSNVMVVTIRQSGTENCLN